MSAAAEVADAPALRIFYRGEELTADNVFELPMVMVGETAVETLEIVNDTADVAKNVRVAANFPCMMSLGDNTLAAGQRTTVEITLDGGELWKAAPRAAAPDIAANCTFVRRFGAGAVASTDGR